MHSMDSDTTMDEDTTELYFDTSNKIPIVYRKEYNIKAFHIEKLHPFDAGKWGNVYKILKKKKAICEDDIIKPNQATKKDLLYVHTKSYLDSLKWSVNVAKIIEVPCAALLPNYILQRKILTPFRYQVGGTVIAGKCAIENGWCINIGGGFHHCCSTKGSGFCPYADITLTIDFVRRNFPRITRIMIVDLDAHQGNGHERDFMGSETTYILDAYNSYIFPKDEFAKQAIRRSIVLRPYTEDEEYLERVAINLEGALNEFRTHLVVYNAGTDILKGDCLGLLSITAEGIIKRDEIVFDKVRKRRIPIIMVTSGGYQRITADVIAESILNLNTKGLINLNT